MAVATSTLLGRPVWYQLMTTDMKAAESFYKTVVGWTAEPFPARASRTRRSNAAATCRSAES